MVTLEISLIESVLLEVVTVVGRDVIVVPFSIVVAVIVVLPGLIAVIKPLLLIVAIWVLELSQLMVLLVLIAPFSSK